MNTIITRRNRKQTLKALLTHQRNHRLETRRLKKAQRKALKRGFRGLVQRVCGLFQ